ncbi:hypothetical protein H072_4079 [Dactylellina haptotyla CBS 200.50]|uniref:Uncharacterized protein n=1 Tax=Dactylellina haptotyla (strain CBS 200.50) TaxID=1284197 RepID=S8AGF7_DACHA|nr:hypothetical protein H072_4079 [Dactylellina haptotyla CBS 200.50]
MAPRGLAAAVWEKREARKKWSEVFHLKKCADTIGGNGECILENDWPEALVDIFRLLLADEYEIQSLQKEDVNRTPISTKNELTVALGLKQAMTQKLAAVRKYNPTRPTTNDHRRYLADTYRKGQEDIIVSKLQNLDNFLANYLTERRLGSKHYLFENHHLAYTINKHPIPTETEYDEDEAPEEIEIIDKAELVLLVAILREYFARENDNIHSDRVEGFWDAFVRLLRTSPGMSLIEFSETEMDQGDTEEDAYGEENYIYEKVADYCNLVAADGLTESYIGRLVTKEHICWAWGVIRLKCINISGADTFLTW